MLLLSLDRIFGRFLWCAIPLLLLVLTTGTAQVIVASSSYPRVDKTTQTSYQACLKDAKTPSDKRSCKPPVAQKGMTVTIDIGKWPWITVIVLVCIGLLNELSRDYKLLRALRHAAESIALATKSNVTGSISPDLLSAYSKTLDMTLNTVPNQVTPTNSTEDAKNIALKPKDLDVTEK